MNYRKLASVFGLEKYCNVLKKALTHKSFYSSDKNDGSSRFVFLGMYGFKGKVSEVLFDYQPANGTQLQHYLGNLFKNEYLHRIYQKYELEKLIRHGVNFDFEKHKHIFVYGFLGFLCKYAQVEILQKFIVSDFMTETQHLLPSDFHRKDITAQCNLLALQYFNKPIKTEVVKNEDNTFTATVKSNEIVLACETSISFKYVKKKAIKKATITLRVLVNNDLLKNHEFIKQQSEEELAKQQEFEQLKLAKQQQLKDRLDQKRFEREKRKTVKKQNAQIKDAALRKAKQAAKERKQKNEEIARGKHAAEQNMSSKKRRHLQDKAK